MFFCTIFSGDSIYLNFENVKEMHFLSAQKPKYLLD